jgi:hypothetical protein
MISLDGFWPHDMVGEITLAIEMGAEAVDIDKTIHPLRGWVTRAASRHDWTQRARHWATSDHSN